MRTPTQALLWELWRTSRVQLLMVIGGQIAFALLLYSLAFVFKEKDVAIRQVVCGIFVMWSTATSAFSQSWRNTDRLRDSQEVDLIQVFAPVACPRQVCVQY